MADLDAFLQTHPSAQSPQRQSWIRAAHLTHPAPTLTAADLVSIIEQAAAIDRDRAWLVYQTLCTILATAVRNRRSTKIEGFGTFRVRRLTASRRLHVSFVPQGDWWGWWMPVLAYDATTLDPIGIWDGRNLLPFGHPDNPYATVAEVPFQPDWAWRAQTPLPGEPPPAPYPHPVRPRTGHIADPNWLRLHGTEAEKAEWRRTRRIYRAKRQAAYTTAVAEKQRLGFRPPKRSI
jgi:hypothetical protein